MKSNPSIEGAAREIPRRRQGLSFSDEFRRGDFSRPPSVATVLLLAMFAVFLLAVSLQHSHPWLAFVRAFAEAAMVGGLVGWFAVSALFRQPMGLPIPHTAVIPKNRERIGEALGNFVEKHLLPPHAIHARLSTIDFGGLVAQWIANPKNAGVIAERITVLLPDLLHGFDEAGLRQLVKDKVSERLDDIDVAPLSGEILAALMADNRYQALLLGEALNQCTALLMEKEPLPRQKIGDNTSWIWRKLSIEERAFHGIVSAVDDVLHELKQDPQHELRQKFEQSVQSFVRNLVESQDYRDRAETVKREIIRHPTLQNALTGTWDEVKAQILSDLESPDSAIKAQLQLAMVRLGEALIADLTPLRSVINRWLRAAIAELIESRRQDVSRLIPDTMRRWDAPTMARRLESQIGRDLQFIRIHGTFVGGLVGLTFHSAAFLVS